MAWADRSMAMWGWIKPPNEASSMSTTTLGAAPTTGARKLPANYGKVYLYVLIIILVCTEATLFRLDDRRINYPLVAAVLILLIPRTLNGLSALSLLRVPTYLITPLFAYIAFCLLSTVWSPNRPETILHTLILGAGMITALSTARFNADTTLRVFVTVSSVVCVLSWIALVIAPDVALQQKGYWRLRGIMNHEFELGFLAAGTIVICAVRWISPGEGPDRWRLGPAFYAIVALAAITFFATQTRTTMVYLVGILGFLGIFYARGNKQLIVIGGVLLVMLLGFFFLEDILAAFSRGEGDATLSGRTTIWARTIALTADVPWFGNGFASFEDPKFDYIWYRYRPPHAHDTWIMAYFETGYTGAALLSLFLAAQLFIGFKLSWVTKRPSAGFFLALLATISGLTSLIYGGKLAALYALPFMVLLQEYAAAYPKKSRKQRLPVRPYRR